MHAWLDPRGVWLALVVHIEKVKNALFAAGVPAGKAESWEGNALCCGSAWAEQGNAAGTRVTGGQSLKILGI